ncbi:MAG: ammonia-forming cytochrome c nitrite reductase subunit c552 [Vicinamibacterales bacterium]
MKTQNNWLRAPSAAARLAAIAAAGCLLTLPAALTEGRVGAQVPPGAQCVDCHQAEVTAMSSGTHAALPLECDTCHENVAGHLADATEPAAFPKVHFDQEVCMSCHLDQYDSFEIESRGRTFYGGSDDSAHPPKGWSKTKDLPYWNVLIDGHPFVLETYEDSPMAVNQIEHQETIRPGSEACMECHGTRAAFMMGVEFTDKLGVLRSLPLDGTTKPKTQVTLPNGTAIQIPAREYTVRSTPSNRTDGHIIYDGTSYLDPTTGEWTEAVNDIVVPAGTKAWTYTDGVNLSGGAYAQKYQVKTLVTLPAPVTVDVLDKRGIPGGSVTFDTIASYPEAGADINGMTGLGPPAAPDANVATVARNWIYATLEALAFDGLDYRFDDPHGETHFTGSGANWPSIESGELCNQCHDPHSGRMRIVKKSLIAAIGERGINPYSPTGQNILTFDEASRQDQIIALCAQCHSEYVGGYSANTKLDQDYFPWAKPADLEALYTGLFGYLQDWTHGGPIAPWQSHDSNARGFFPYGQRFDIGVPLVKVQHPEAEVFLGSPMYNAGATCTDCHSARLTRPDGTRYTTHWFTSPLKLMEGFAGQTVTGKSVSFAPQNPCAKCHTTDTIAQSRKRIEDVQDAFWFVQERTQVALVNALKFIKEQKALGRDQTANIAAYQRASMRWEYYTQAENSMGFHNAPEATTEVANARIWVDAFIPWPLTPVNVRIASTGPDNLTLLFYDQATDERAFIVERAEVLEGPYTLIATVPTPNGVSMGDVEFTDSGLAPGQTYFYRVSAWNAAGTSVPSIWASAATGGGATPVSAPTDLSATPVSGSQIDLAWADNSNNEVGFRIERAKDVAFSVELAVLGAPAGAASFSDAGLTHTTTYFYRVFAIAPGSGGGTSAPSNTASATTLAAPPAAPADLRVTASGRTSIAIAWTDTSSNEDGFFVERKQGSGAWSQVAALPAGQAAWRDNSVSRRQTYSYRVQAYNIVGTSTYSNTVTARTK